MLKKEKEKERKRTPKNESYTEVINTKQEAQLSPRDRAMRRVS